MKQRDTVRLTCTNFEKNMFLHRGLWSPRQGKTATIDVKVRPGHTITALSLSHTHIYDQYSENSGGKHC